MLAIYNGDSKKDTKRFPSKFTSYGLFNLTIANSI